MGLIIGYSLRICQVKDGWTIFFAPLIMSKDMCECFEILGLGLFKLESGY